MIDLSSHMEDYTEKKTTHKQHKPELLIDSFTSGLLDKIDAFVFIFDVEENKPVWLNEHFYKRLKFTPDDLKELTSEKFLELIHPKSRTRFVDRLSKLKQEDSNPIRTVYQVKNRDQKWVKILVCSRPYERNEDGTLKYLVGFATEVDQVELAKHANEIRNLDNKYEGFAQINKLSKRELDVVRLISRGYTDKEIAEKLQVSIHTTKTHRKRIISKMGLKNTALLVKFAVENGLT